MKYSKVGTAYRAKKYNHKSLLKAILEKIKQKSLFNGDLQNIILLLKTNKEFISQI